MSALTTNPGVWRTTAASVVAAGVSAGVIAPELGDQINTWVGIAVIVATAVLPIAASLWAKSRTAPVAAGTLATKVLVRGADGVYAATTVLPAPDPAHQIAQPTHPAEPSTWTTGGYRGGDVTPPD